MHGGTDTYGRVKTVNGTSVRTTFVMISGVPLFPVQCFYCERGAVVNSVYSDDPLKNEHAIFFSELTYDEMLSEEPEDHGRPGRPALP